MKLIVTIDTEEDNWGSYNPTSYSVNNIKRISELQMLFEEHEVIPTYLITYSVATDPFAISIFKGIVQREGCEIGAHCHPWNTPPFIEHPDKRNSMLCNLPAELQFRKLSTLHQTISDNFKMVPTSFRAGRWGYGKEVALSLKQLGYKVDSSILSFYDWTDIHGPNCSMISPEPYWFNPDRIYQPSSEGEMLEVPGVVAYAQSNFRRCNDVFNFFKTTPLRYLRIIGMLDKLNMLNRIWLSPEQSTADQMITLIRRLISERIPVANLYFHSPTLEPGLTPYVKSESDRRIFLDRIRAVMQFARENQIESIRLSDAVNVVSTC